MLTVAVFLASLGVNTHMDAANTGYGDVPLVVRSLAYLGVEAVRDHAWATDLPAYRQLAAAGIKLDLIVDDDPAASTAAMIPIRDAIIAFEGSNEVDVQAVPVARAVAGQQALYAAVKSNPALRSIPVLNLSVGDPAHDAIPAATAAFADAANLHAYAAWGDMPRYVIPSRIERQALAGKPSIVTETGYFTMLNHEVDPSGVSESVQARLTLDTVLDDFAAGVERTYLYELLDESPDPGQTDPERHYGLFHADGTPKPAAIALHNLTTILTAPSPAGPARPAPTVTDMPAEGRTLFLADRDGRSAFVVWAEPQIWNTALQTELPLRVSRVTVSLGASVATVSVFDPTVGTDPVAAYRDVSQVGLDVTDHPLVIRTDPVSLTPRRPTAAERR